MRVVHPSETVTLCLTNDQLVSMVTDEATRIVSDLGVAWITVEGETRDHILRAGESVTLPPDRLVVVQALGSPLRVTVVSTRTLRAKAA